MTNHSIKARPPDPSLVHQLMPDGVTPVTVSRLWQLRPDQSMQLYAGNLELDLARSAGDDEAPQYHKLLTLIQLAVAELEGQGRIRVTKQPLRIEGGRTVVMFVYTATGVRQA